MVLAEVTDAQASGDFAADDPPEATGAVLVLCRGVSDWYRPGGPLGPEEVSARYQRFALALVGDRAAEQRGPAVSTTSTEVPSAPAR